jgi:hypothetical protein
VEGRPHWACELHDPAGSLKAQGQTEALWLRHIHGPPGTTHLVGSSRLGTGLRRRFTSALRGCRRRLLRSQELRTHGFGLPRRLDSLRARVSELPVQAGQVRSRPCSRPAHSLGRLRPRDSLPQLSPHVLLLLLGSHAASLSLRSRSRSGSRSRTCSVRPRRLQPGLQPLHLLGCCRRTLPARRGARIRRLQPLARGGVRGTLLVQVLREAGTRRRLQVARTRGQRSRRTSPWLAAAAPSARRSRLGAAARSAARPQRAPSSSPAARAGWPGARPPPPHRRDEGGLRAGAAAGGTEGRLAGQRAHHIARNPLQCSGPGAPVEAAADRAAAAASSAATARASAAAAAASAVRRRSCKLAAEASAASARAASRASTSRAAAPDIPAASRASRASASAASARAPAAAAAARSSASCALHSAARSWAASALARASASCASSAASAVAALACAASACVFASAAARRASESSVAGSTRLLGLASPADCTACAGPDMCRDNLHRLHEAGVTAMRNPCPRCTPAAHATPRHVAVAVAVAAPTCSCAVSASMEACSCATRCSAATARCSAAVAAPRCAAHSACQKLSCCASSSAEGPGPPACSCASACGCRTSSGHVPYLLIAATHPHSPAGCPRGAPRSPHPLQPLPQLPGCSLRSLACLLLRRQF